MTKACNAEYFSDCPEVRKVQREKARLEADVSTYEHLDHIRRMLREFGNALIARGESHDRSKLSPAERDTFAEFVPKLKHTEYGSDEYKNHLAAMAPALAHHYACNRHHPEHFIDGVNGMNLVDLVEMFIDWYASSLRNKDGDIRASIRINQKRFCLSDQLTEILMNTVDDLEKKSFFDNTNDPTRIGEPRVKARHERGVDGGQATKPTSHET